MRTSQRHRPLIQRIDNRHNTMSATYAQSISNTRPSNTTAYGAGAVIGVADVSVAANAGSGIMAFTGFTLGNTSPNGSQILITDCNLEIDVAAVPSGQTTFRLHLYNAAPDAVLDGATWDLASAGDRLKYLGWIDILAMTDLGSTLYSQNPSVNKKVILAAGSSALYGVLTTVGGYTPTSAAVKVLTLHAVEMGQ